MSPNTQKQQAKKQHTQHPLPVQTDPFYQTQLLNLSQTNETPDFEDIPLFGSLPELLLSLWQHLGLDVRFIRNGATLPESVEETFCIGISGGSSPGQLVLLPTRDIRKPKLVGQERQRFLSALAQLMGDAYRWQQTLRQYEEILAAPIDLSAFRRQGESLFQLLKESAKLVDCCAASLYLLDSQRKTLKLRSCWGLPEERLLNPPRSLHDSLADVEAILGQVVVVNEDYLFEMWRVPEDFPMAICLPVTSPQTVWGTLWLFSDCRRDCTEYEARLLEYISGRLSSELENTALRRDETYKME